MSVSVFAERLRNAMNSRGLKQVDLVHAAEHRGVKMGKSHISQYVAGKTMPREDVLEFLASELDVDMNWLRGEESTTQLNSDASNSVTDGEHAATPLATGASKPQTDSEIPVGRRRTFGKSHKLDNVLYDVRGPVADEAMRMEANGTHILKLNIGNPAPFGFRTPDEVVYDMAHQLTDTEGYSPSKGLFSARKAIMQYAQLKNIPNVTIDDIYTGNGVSELINLSMSALLDTGDEVLVPSPDYPLWTACVTLAGGTPVHYICDEQAEWYPDIDDIKKKVTPRTKAIVIINPNNPTGTVVEKEYLATLISHNPQVCFVIDQSYEFFTLRPLFSAAEAAEFPNVLLLHSMTKRYAVPGLRLGYVIGAPHLLHRLRTNRMPWSVNQLAIEAGLHLLEHDVPNPLDVASYLQEAARLRSALEALGGLEVWATETHFMLVCLRMGRASALKDYLAGEHGILIRDASNFDGLNEHFFRIAAQSREENDRLVKAIGQWLEEE